MPAEPWLFCRFWIARVMMSCAGPVGDVVVAELAPRALEHAHPRLLGQVRDVVRRAPLVERRAGALEALVGVCVSAGRLGHGGSSGDGYSRLAALRDAPQQEAPDESGEGRRRGGGL